MSKPVSVASIAIVVVFAITAGYWTKLVNETVNTPYLDEVFHVRQAQNYCKHRFNVWDPKITTPPGLYYLSYALSGLSGCDLPALRASSLASLWPILVVVFCAYVQRQRGQSNSILNQHGALNIGLFPPLFFFSALYYTDVASTLSVLLFYLFFLHSRSVGSKWWHTPVLVLLGTASLTFRQTNIFWVAIFPAGLELVHHIDRGHDVVKESMYRRVEGFSDSMLNVAKTSWKMEVVYDPSVRDAWLEDYIDTTTTILVLTLKHLIYPTHLLKLLRALAPPLTLLALFTTFIYWNGSVVLGDKSNHIATLHLPQMLYIWPYFVFFSWPLIYPYLSIIPIGLYAQLSHVAFLETMLIFKRRRLVPRLWLVTTFTALACLAVRYNTVIHPFLLADNRHYIFYIFRLLLRPWWIRYAVTPLYVVLGWACIQALGARPFETTVSTRYLHSKDEELPSVQAEDQARGLPLPDGTNSATTTFVLIWLATTSLQLITAPLVEPRYLILPWIFWRIHVPLQRYRSWQDNANGGQEGSESSDDDSGFDHRLWLETSWFLLINAVTGFVFLKWEFGWPQEPGVVQRFMW